MSLDKKLTENDINIIKIRCQNTSPGPWIAYVEGRDFDGGSSIISGPKDDIEIFGATAADFDFIAHSRTDIVLLIDEIQRLKNLISFNKIIDS